MIMKKLSTLFLALFIIAVTACNAGFTSNNDNDFESTSSEKATISINVNKSSARSTVFPLEVTEDDVTKIVFRAQKLKKAVAEGTGETFVKDGEAYKKEWVNKKEYDEDDKLVLITAFEQMEKDPNLPAFDVGFYDFELELYTLSIATENEIIMNLTQADKIDAKELVAGKNTVNFNTKYVENKGELYVQFGWSSDIDSITKIEAGLFTVESNGKEAYVKDKISYDFTSLGEIKTQYENESDKDYVNYVEYKVLDLPNGDYYLKFKVYGTNPLTGKDLLLNEYPPSLVKIGGYITYGIVELTDKILNSFYTVKCILDEGEWKDSKAFEVTRNAYETVTLPTADQLTPPKDKQFVGWAECDESGNIKDGAEANCTTVEAKTEENTWFKAIWKQTEVVTPVTSTEAQITFSIEEINDEDFENLPPTNLTYDDIEEVSLTAQKLNSEGEYEAYGLAQDKEGKPVYTLTWTPTEEEKQNATDSMTGPELVLECGTYNFTLNLYTKPTASYVNEYHLTQTGVLEAFEVNEKTNSIDFATKYVDNGNLKISFEWNAEEPDAEIKSRIGKIEAGLFITSGKELIVYRDFESLPVVFSNNVLTAEYEKTTILNGTYTVCINLYDIDEETLLEQGTVSFDVDIKGFKTETKIPIDLSSNYKLSYDVDYVFDYGPYSNGKWKTALTDEQKKHSIFTDLTLPGSDAVEYEGGGFIFKGWYEKLDSDNNPIGTPITVIKAGLDNAHDYKLYAGWEIEESSGSTINVGFDADRTDLSVQLSKNGIFYTYTITPPDSTESYEYTYYIDGTPNLADSNVIVINTDDLQDNVCNLSIIAVGTTSGKSYSYNNSIEISKTTTKVTPQGYELKTGLDINPIFNQFVDAASAENKQIIAFAKSTTVPADTIEVQYLDTAEANVPVWLEYNGDTTEATVYYYVEDGYKLILSTYCNTMFNGFPDIKTIETSDFYTGNVKYMMYMFAFCPALESLDLSMFDISSVVQLNSMFNGCSALKTIYVNEDADWRYTDIITDSADMFSGCTQLPGYTSAYKDKSKAYAGEGGYFTVKE